MKKLIEKLKDIWESVKDSSTIVRWFIILSVIFGLMLVAGFEVEEFRVTILLIWYGFISTALSSLLTYVYGKVNYHSPKDNISAMGQVAIFCATMLFSGLIILGTYIAQYN